MLLTKGTKHSSTLILLLIHSNFMLQENSLSNWFAVRNSMESQWLGLSAFTARGPSSIPGWGTKILQASQRSQKKTGLQSSVKTLLKNSYGRTDSCLNTIYYHNLLKYNGNSI